MNDMPKISQEMIKIYDDYTHLTLDRRNFMQKAHKTRGFDGRRGGHRAVAGSVEGAGGDRGGGRSRA